MATAGQPQPKGQTVPSTAQIRAEGNNTKCVGKKRFNGSVTYRLRKEHLLRSPPSHFGQGRVQIIRSSLPYQVLLYLNAWYFGFFFICEILLFIFKAETLPYADSVLPAEIILVFLLTGIEALRIFFARKGNLTERIVGVLVSIVLSIPAVVGALYLILWQTYVLRIDVILAAIQVVFIGLELVFGIISMITFARATPY